MKKNIRIKIFIISVFVYGVLLGKYEVFPMNIVKLLKQKILAMRIEAFNNPIDNKEKLNVLIIGDSISVGYTPFVRDMLKNKLDIYRILENGRYSSYGKRQLDNWLSLNKHWDIIHFNWGLWDLQYINPDNENINGIQRTTPEEYKSNLEYIVNKLKNTGAKLIWCNTTPVPMNATMAQGIPEDVIRYNNIAIEIANKNNIRINDLYSFALKNINSIQLKNNVHFNSDGSKYLATKVAKEILKEIKQNTIFPEPKNQPLSIK